MYRIGHNCKIDCPVKENFVRKLRPFSKGIIFLMNNNKSAQSTELDSVEACTCMIGFGTRSICKETADVFIN